MKNITAEDLLQRMDSGEQFHVVDVRENDEVAQGIIPGAIHIPLGELQNRHSELNRETSYIMVCRSGGRSAMASNILDDLGYDVTNMTGGMLAWEGEVEL
ncbi:rhodanese-like domain-containing protein [Chungangia koreensis]|uniref:Rhodanese-like domain-containing protein n=1 Tax=Chungangia koreensis TaxID=752657 RepID=A0ABV8X068_9LACT